MLPKGILNVKPNIDVSTIKIVMKMIMVMMRVVEHLMAVEAVLDLVYSQYGGGGRLILTFAATIANTKI